MKTRVSLLQTLLALLLERFDVQAIEHHIPPGVLGDERAICDPVIDNLAFHTKELCHLAGRHQLFRWDQSRPRSVDENTQSQYP